MKRHQIRRMISVNVSDAQLRRAIADLGLPADDNHTYTEEESRQILNQFRLQQPTGNEKLGGHASGARHHQTHQAAHQSCVQEQATLSVRTQQHLATIQASLNKIAADREVALEQVSDTLAYLYSPQTFQADVLSRTAAKLALQPVEPEPDSVLTLDTLGDCFAQFAASVEYPAIATTSVAGCLPL